MLIGGFQKVSLIDYPEKISSVIFTMGCGFRCLFCHNSQLVLKDRIKALKRIDEKEIFEFLEKRKKFIEAVTITGGEPTVQKGLEKFIHRIKQIGYLVKVDTNGSRPDVLKGLLKQNLIDFVAMDVKTVLTKEKYSAVCGVEVNDTLVEKIISSINLIMNSGIDHEFRTTVVPGLHTPEDVEKVCEQINGAKKFAIQNFIPRNCVDRGYESKKPFSEKELKEFSKVAKRFIKNVEVRTNY